MKMRDYIMEFAECRGRQDEQGFPCNRFSDEHIPLYMFPSPTAHIMLISESPSEPASTRRALNSFENLTFVDDVLPLIFGETLIPRGRLKEEFDENFYWAHFCKCFPGAGDEKPKSLNRICANYYLRREIELFNPQFIISVGNPTSTFLFGIKRGESMEPLVNRINRYDPDGLGIPTICITHFSGANREHNKRRLQFEETRDLLRRTLVEDYGVRYINME
jgi:uracil-DNA glycosylase family 4